MTERAKETRGEEKGRAALEFDEALRQAGERCDRLLLSSPALIRGYTAHLAGVHGKMIRASALMACASGEDGLVPPDAVELAAAIELLHLATLVHDDVIDDADVRRGAPTLRRRFGRRAAVICGDYLLSAALRAAAQVARRAFDREGAVELPLPDYVSQICMGELRQQMNHRNLRLTPAQYLRIISGKTAALFEASYYGGAALCTREERLLRRYRMLGRNVGMIFQITDDCIDFESDEATAKKPVQSDYEQGVVTLPLIHALGQDGELRERAERGQVSREELCHRVRESGGLDYARLLSKRYYDRAARLTGELEAPPEKRRRLTELLDRAYYGLKMPVGESI